MRQQRLLRIQLHNRQSRKNDIGIVKFCICIRENLILIAIADRIGAPVIAVIIRKNQPDVLRARCGQADIGPCIGIVHPQRAVECIASRVVAQRLSMVFKLCDQRRFALPTFILNRPDDLNIRNRLHHWRIRGSIDHNRRQHAKQQRHAGQDAELQKALHMIWASPLMYDALMPK